MKILRGCRDVADLNVVFGAGLQESLKSRAGMLRSLPFVAMRQKQNDPARSLPLRLRRHDKLIDDRLRAIREIAELRFPKAKHVWVIERIPVIKTENGRLGKKAVVYANAGLLRREI